MYHCQHKHIEVNATHCMLYLTGADQEDHELSEVAMEEDLSSGRDVEGESSSSSRWRGRGGKNQKKKFDISLPAQHLVRLKKFLWCALNSVNDGGNLVFFFFSTLVSLSKREWPIWRMMRPHPLFLSSVFPTESCSRRRHSPCTYTTLT